MAEALTYLQRARETDATGVPTIEQALRVQLDKSLGDAFVRELEQPAVELELSPDQSERVRQVTRDTQSDGRIRLLLKPWLDGMTGQGAA